jgi:non-canonical poly(A) RNA polymerase PAPD5/7
VEAFGSFAAGLYLPTADMDLVLVSERMARQRRPSILADDPDSLSMISRILNRQDIAKSGSIEVIAKARVPLVKYVDWATGIKVDLSFDNMSGIFANRTFETWKTQFPAMPYIVAIVKQYLLMRGLNEVFAGGLGGFSIICLVVSLLQHMPSVQSGNMDPRYNLGEVLLNFFDLYGNKLEYTTTGIQLRPPCYYIKVSPLTESEPRF